jgi:3-deoxy-D-manno-octulosonic-acid transferase
MTTYDVLYALALGVSSPVWLLIPKLRRKILDAVRERNGSVESGDTSRPAILIHAVSMGEINATTSLVRLLSESHRNIRFIISTTSKTGNERSRTLYANNPNVTRIRFPFDFSKCVARLLDAQRPKVAVLMELEVWPNFMAECGKRNIPVILINGRLSAHSFRNYRLALPLTRPMFKRLSLACVQEQTYAERFRRVGVPADRVHVTGTMKFDTAQVAERIDGDDALARAVGIEASEKVWVCGSTGPGEEQAILDIHIDLRKAFPNLRLIIVPRHPERFDEVADLIQSRGLSLLRRSRTVAAASGDTPVILGDTMGELRKFYSLATIVFVGRTLLDLGPKQHGSDMIEPGALAKPVIVGPFTGNFTEVMNRFREASAIREVRDAAQLRQAVGELLLSPIAAREMGERAQSVVIANKGATGRHVKAILELLESSEVGRDAQRSDSSAP